MHGETDRDGGQCQQDIAVPTHGARLPEAGGADNERKQGIGVTVGHRVDADVGLLHDVQKERASGVRICCYLRAGGVAITGNVLAPPASGNSSFTSVIRKRPGSSSITKCAARSKVMNSLRGA